MNEAVDEHEHPNRRAHVADAGPHAKHGAGVMVCLQGRTPLAFGQDDGGVNDLVELAHVEEPSPESQTFVPQSAHICRVRVTIVPHLDQRVLDLEDVGCGVVGGGIAQAPGSVHLAQRIGDTSSSCIVVQAGPDVHNSSCHGSKGDEGVDGQHNIVSHDKVTEGFLVGDIPWLVRPSFVETVEVEDDEDIGGAEENRDLPAQGVEEEGLVDADGGADRAFVYGRGKRVRSADGLGIEREGRRPGQVDVRPGHDRVVPC